MVVREVVPIFLPLPIISSGLMVLYLYTSSISMSEQQRETPTHSHSPDYQHPLQDHSGKFKPIKKQRADRGKEQQGKLTKQQRMKIQKEKNREAAQRSRDQHKEYVAGLENELRMLKERLELNRKYCFQCQRELEDEARFFEEESANDGLNYNQDGIFQEGDGRQQEMKGMKEEPAEVPREEEYFLRLNDQEEDLSYLKLMLFVAMIAIGVYIYYPSISPATDASRKLLQVYQTPLSKPMPIKEYPLNPLNVELEVNDTLVIQPHSPELLMDLNRGLVVRSSVLNQQCLDSLFDKQAFSLANLRTAHPSLGKEVGDGILLCSFEQQRGLGSTYQQGSSKSAFLRLFLMGAEIKQMVTANSPIKKFVQSNLQLNGIYRVNAEVKQVELISHHNCLL